MTKFCTNTKRTTFIRGPLECDILLKIRIRIRIRIRMKAAIVTNQARAT